MGSSAAHVLQEPIKRAHNVQAVLATAHPLPDHLPAGRARAIKVSILILAQQDLCVSHVQYVIQMQILQVHAQAERMDYNVLVIRDLLAMGSSVTCVLLEPIKRAHIVLSVPATARP